MLIKFREHINNLKGRRDQKEIDLKRALSETKRLKIDVEESEDAQTRIQLVAKITQDQLRVHIVNPVTAALSGVFDDPYKFELRFELRRGKYEPDMIFSRDGIEHKDLTFSGGGGAVDVAALGLQIASLFMSGKEKFLLLDEPLSALKSKNKELERRGGLMMQELGKELSAQFLIISHIPEQQEGADKVFRFTIKKGITQTEEVK